MARKHFRIGVMFSTTGSYSVVARSMLNGALLAFAEVAAQDDAVTLEPVVVALDDVAEIRRHLAV